MAKGRFGEVDLGFDSAISVVRCQNGVHKLCGDTTCCLKVGTRHAICVYRRTILSTLSGATEHTIVQCKCCLCHVN